MYSSKNLFQMQLKKVLKQDLAKRVKRDDCALGFISWRLMVWGFTWGTALGDLHSFIWSMAILTRGMVQGINKYCSSSSHDRAAIRPMGCHQRAPLVLCMSSKKGGLFLI